MVYQNISAGEIGMYQLLERMMESSDPNTSKTYRLDRNRHHYQIKFSNCPSKEHKESYISYGTRRLVTIT